MLRSKPKPSPRTKRPKHLKSNANTSTPRASSARGGTTKHDRILGLLRAKSGTTIAFITELTGWQPHSVRGFLAGIVKKKLGLCLLSEKTGSGRVYRIVEAKHPVSSSKVRTTSEQCGA